MRYLVLFAALAVLFARFAVHVVAHAARAFGLWLVTPLARIQAARGFVLGLTLVEAAKLETGDSYRQAVIELYAGSSSILSILDFMPIQGNALKYNREGELPGVAFRGVNEGYTPSTGVLNPLTESLVIAGGDLDVDKFIIDTMGARQRSVQEAMKVRALALAWTKKFFKGDSTADPREFDGLQLRVVGNQIIDAGATAGGDALSLSKLDQAIARTLNCTHIVMNTALALKFIAAARTVGVSGNVTQGTDTMGRPITLYAGKPIVTVDLDATGAEILGFSEASPGGGAAVSTSIYCVSIGDDSLMGLENGGIDVRDLGELQTAPKYRTRVEWYNGIAIFNGRAVTRLRGIKDAAIVA